FTADMASARRVRCLQQPGEGSSGIPLGYTRALSCPGRASQPVWAAHPFGCRCTTSGGVARDGPAGECEPHHLLRTQQGKTVTPTDMSTADAVSDRLAAATTLADLFLATADAHPDQVALRSHESGLELTYRQARARVGAIADRVRSLGVDRGEPVALMLRNRPEFHLVDTAVMLLGAVPFSLYNTSPPDQLAYVLADAGATTVITESGFLDVLETA